MRRRLNQRIGKTGLSVDFLTRLWASAAVAALVAWAIRWMLPDTGSPVAAAGLILGPFALTFLAATLLADVPEARAIVRRARPRPGAAG